MIARIRTVVDVSFDFEVGEADENGERPGAREAAEHANSTVIEEVKAAINAVHPLVDELCLVEEVREQ